MGRREKEKDRGSGSGSEKHVGLLRLAQVLTFLVVFAGGVVIGLTTSSHIHSENLTSQPYQNVSVRNVPSPSEHEANLELETFLHPLNLSHSLSDQELFWRASLIPKKEAYPYARVPKVAFMFLTRGPLPMLPLWERFFHGHSSLFSIYIHAPPLYTLNISPSSPFYLRNIPSQDVSWGSFTLADAERRLLANALLDFSNERFLLLSDTCIPLFDFPTVYSYLTHSSLSFVQSYDELTRYGRGRYSRHMLPHIHLRHWRKGSQWFELNRSLAVSIVSDTKYYSLFRKYCKPACYPDEHYIPTFLHMFHGSLNSNRTVTWVDWSMLGPHPATFGRANITASFFTVYKDQWFPLSI